MPGRDAFIFGWIIRPSESRSTPRLKRHAQMRLIPFCEFFRVRPCFQKYAADSRNSRHVFLLLISICLFGLWLQHWQVRFPWANFVAVLLGHHSCYLPDVSKVVDDPG